MPRRLAHQDRRRLQVPVSIGHMRVAEIGAECHDVTGDRAAIVTALLQRANREGVAQIVDARVAPSVHTPEAGAIEELEEDIAYGVIG